MSRSKPRRAKGAAAGGGGRLQTVGLFVVFALLAALIGSVAWGVLGRRGGGGAPGPGTPQVSAAAPAGRVRVEVLNASGTPGLANEGRRVLRDAGFDVLSIGNAPAGSSPDSSLVLDRVGKVEPARAVADALGIRRVEPKPDANLYLDVTVVLGRDWTPPAAPGATEQP
ncbi:MAG TPA: LytR C-terminal domain-containing protein [Longimicrobium sp.]|nr:LytR C-terminal domain-containing protein [Longimicrobium sp.]